MSIDLETYEGQVAQLDVEYVLALGEDVRARLFPAPKRDGVLPYPLPVGAIYEPGNSTRYGLIFVPVRTIQPTLDPASQALRRVPEGCFDADGNARPGWVFVASTSGEQFGYPFDLAFGTTTHCAYVAEHTGLGLADSAAVTALLRAITGVALI